jgi:hypothetical protein
MRITRRATVGFGAGVVAGTALAALPAGRPPLAATFLQLLSADRRLGVEVWRERISEWQTLGVDTLYLQWLGLDGIDLLTPGPDGPGAAALLEACAAAGVRFHLGLEHRPAEDAALLSASGRLAAALAERRAASLVLAEKALALAQPEMLAGWYLPLELNDLQLRDTALRALLADHIAACATALWQLTPDLPVTASAFTSRDVEAEPFAAMLDAVWPRDGRFAFLLQDGVGAGLRTPASILPVAAAVAQLADQRRQNWGLVVELFTQVSGPPVSDGAFAAWPAPIGRVRAQLTVAERFPRAERVAFAIPHYMANSAGPAAAALAAAYRDTLVSPSPSAP